MSDPPGVLKTTSTHASSAREVVKRTNSNLALALITLPKDRRDDMITLYQFCREVDDVVDEGDLSSAERCQELDQWKRVIASGYEKDDPTVTSLQAATFQLTQKYPLIQGHLLDVIEGVAMDLEVEGYPTWEDLRLYCYRVASAVGLASIEIFGYENELTRDYAISLGYALQITNIMRDVRKDLEIGRVYLPLKDLEDAGYSVEQLKNREFNAAFRRVMQVMADRAWHHHHQAIQSLPEIDRKKMHAAEMMAQIYQEILLKMCEDHFQVFEKDYKVKKSRLFLILGSHYFKNLLGMA